MKIKLMTILAVAMVPVVLVLTGYPPAIAEPTGELKIALTILSYEGTIPSMERAQAKDFLGFLYDPLVGADTKAAISTDLGLAEKWEMSPDARTWTFSLRKGVKFHDGVEVTAKDAKFSIELVMRPVSKSGDAGMMRETVESMEVKDPYTLVVRCKRPFMFLPHLLSNITGTDGYIQPKDSYEKVGEEKFMEHPIGSGPYKFHSRTIGSFLKLEATDRHWRDGVQRYKYVTFLIIPEESSRIALLKTGRAHIADISKDKVGELEKAGLKVVSKAEADLVNMSFGSQWMPGPFSDVRFRKACNLAINRDEVIKHIFSGMAKHTTTFPGSAAMGLGGDTTLKPYPYDPEQAKKLLKEGGYEGHEFNVVSYPRAGCPEMPQAVEAAVGYWQAIGLKPKIIMTEYPAWRLKRRAGQTYNHISGGEVSIAPVYSSVISYIRLQTHSKESMTSIKSPELDQMIDRAETSMDLEEIRKLIGDIHRYFYNNYNFIPLVDIGSNLATTKEVGDWDIGRRRSEFNFNDIVRQR